MSVAPLLLSSGLVLLSVPALAGEGRGTISGSVAADGAPFEDAIVYIKSVPEAHPARELTLDLGTTTSAQTAKVGDTVVFKNDGQHPYELKRLDAKAETLGLVRPGGTHRVTFAKEGIYVRLSPESRARKAYLFIGQNPYAATLDERGNFVIPNVPPGNYELAIWSPRLPASVQRVTVVPGVVSVQLVVGK